MRKPVIPNAIKGQSFFSMFIGKVIEQTLYLISLRVKSNYKTVE